MPKEGSKQSPKTEAHRELGAELRRVRKTAGKTTRQMYPFSDTQVSRVENGLDDASRRFVEVYIEIGGDRVRLLSMLDRVRRASENLRDKKGESATLDEEAAKALAPESDFHELRRTYRVEEFDDHYLIGPHRAAIRATHLVRVRPLTRYSRYFVLSYETGESARRGVMTIQPGQGCELSHFEENDRGTLRFVLDYNPGGRATEDRLYDFTYTVEFHDDEPMSRRPLLRNSTRSGVRRVVKRVQFTEPALPERIWWFKEIEILDTHAEPRPDQLLPLNAAHFYLYEFNDLVDEYVGLGWDWLGQAASN